MTSKEIAFKAVTRSFESFLDIRVLFLMAVPFLVASFCMILFLFLFWATWTDFLIGTEVFKWLMGTIGDNFLLTSLKFVVIFLATLFIFGPLWYLSCIILISVFLFPLLLPHLQKRFYPDLEKKFGGHFFGSLKNVGLTTLVYLLFLTLTLPFWFFTPIGPLISLVATAYLNKNIFSYDVLQDYATKEELLGFGKKYFNESWWLGFFTALIAWLPIINILAPALTALVFIHFYLGSLQNDRLSKTTY